MTFRDFSSMMKKANSGRKKRSVTCKKSQAHTSAAWLRRNVFQVCPRARNGANRLHILLKGPFTHPNIGLKEFPTDALRRRRLFAAICWNNAIVSHESPGLLERAFDLCFQNKRKSSRCQHSRVSGRTRKSACFQVRTILASSTRRSRSVLR